MFLYKTENPELFSLSCSPCIAWVGAWRVLMASTAAILEPRVSPSPRKCSTGDAMSMRIIALNINAKLSRVYGCYRS